MTKSDAVAKRELHTAREILRRVPDKSQRAHLVPVRPRESDGLVDDADKTENENPETANDH